MRALQLPVRIFDDRSAKLLLIVVVCINDAGVEKHHGFLQRIAADFSIAVV